MSHWNNLEKGLDFGACLEAATVSKVDPVCESFYRLESLNLTYITMSMPCDERKTE